MGNIEFGQRGFLQIMTDLVNDNNSMLNIVLND